VALEEAITRTSARLLVIDVVMAYLPTGTDSHRGQDVRRVLSRLAALADRAGCTVLLWPKGLRAAARHGIAVPYEHRSGPSRWRPGEGRRDRNTTKSQRLIASASDFIRELERCK